MESVNSDNLYYMKQAFKEAEKSKCPRTKVGCILIKDSNILAVAHNSEVLDLDRCSKNGCIRIANGVPSGLNVEICRGIHAEQKLIITCSLCGINPSGGTVYITHSPCYICAKMLLEAGIVELYYSIDYSDIGFKCLFDENGLKYNKLEGI
ncbi:cytidine deaminase [Enterocloster sp. 210928-DFI.2.20]|jgi:dCMP deaminase|uniref:deoxycytidylate deaminase n=1 Tax=Enterocloster TaxID=2719313 RepID=UPI001D08BF13|nr:MULTISPECIES: deaminase [Enterocloster]MCB7093899.1 cytidine deaminase [Enterocloster sp. 210928-DFI.2.20]MCB7352692.1 cytidine deaminase [Enterocloster bolteae]